MKKRNVIGTLLLILIFLIMILSIVNIYLFLNIKTTTQRNIYDTEEYFIYRNGIYQNLASDIFIDDYVTDIAYQCLHNTTKTLCVYDSIPFVYNYTRAEVNPNNILTPEYMMKYGSGVCRDITYFRKAVFNNLRMNSSYVFEPNHVYLKVNEHNNTYYLENSCIYTRNSTNRNYLNCKEW